MSDELRGGLLVRLDRGLHFIAATTAVRVAPVPDLTRIPAAPAALLGIASFEGDVIPVVSVGDDRSAMVVCTVDGERLGVVGAAVVGAGLFQAQEAGSGVSFAGEPAELLDVAALHARLRAAAWTVRRP